jgi:hypothetical protein
LAPISSREVSAYTKNGRENMHKVSNMTNDRFMTVLYQKGSKNTKRIAKYITVSIIRKI